jgi:formylglycine-generating enzyme required for sulfatase activity
MSEPPIPPNQPEQDIGVLGRPTFANWWDAVLGGPEAITQYPLIPRRQCQLEPFNFTTLTLEGKEQKPFSRQGRRYQEAFGRQFCLEMVRIAGDTFLMGSAESGQAGMFPYLQHKATVAPFFISQYPITQMQWLTIAVLPPLERMLPLMPSYFQGASHPVEQVSWYEATEFCARLSRLTGRCYRLPMEIEWEYACRAGSHTAFHFGDHITPWIANYRGTVTEASGQVRPLFRQTTTSVGSFPYANAFGLYDMHGNVWEWCNDKTEQDLFLPIGLRGGAWSSPPAQCQSSFRYSMDAKGRSSDVGLRVVCQSLEFPSHSHRVS